MDALSAAEIFVLAFCGAFAAIVVAFLLAYNFAGLRRGFDMQHALGFLAGCLIVVLASFAARSLL